MRSKRIICPLLASALFIVPVALIGFIILLSVTAPGVGISADSSVYIGAARALLKGRGLTEVHTSEAEPMTHFPPLFPTILAIIGIFGIDPLNGARWLNAFLFGANILMVGIVISRYTRDCVWVSLFGSFLMLSSPFMIEIHSWAWSEPVFIFFGILGLFFIDAHIRNANYLFLFASSGAIALAWLARYIGITLVATGILGIVFLSRKTYYARILDSVLFTAISSFPMVLWLIRNLYLTGAATDRSISFHPITSDHFKTFLGTVSAWLLPYRFYQLRVLSLFALMALSAFGIFASWKEEKLDGISSIKHGLAKLHFPFIIFIAGYVMFLIISITFLDASTPLDKRILSPIHASGLIFILYAVYNMLHPMKSMLYPKAVLIVLCIAFAGLSLWRGAQRITEIANDGLGYSGRTWQCSETVERIKSLPSEIPIFSNEPHAIHFLTGRTASYIPWKVERFTRQSNDNYSSDLDRMEEQIRKGDGILVYFNTVRRKYQPSEKELNEQLQLHLLTEEGDGSIYELDHQNR